MRQDNIFKVGDVVAGESLIGYEEIYKQLRRYLLENRGNLAVVGLHRMGKTSLVKKLQSEAQKYFSKIVVVFVNLHELIGEEGKSLFDSLLIHIAEEVRDSLARRIDLDDPICKDFRNTFDHFEKSRCGSMTFRNSFKNLFEEIKALKLHVLLSLDEFDAAEKIFTSTADYELFRTLADPKYAVGLVFISRRRLYMIEKKNDNNSTFHGAFKENPITGFSEVDTTLLFESLKKNYDIALSEAQRERLKYYAGNSPYIYSAFCHEFVERKIVGQNSFEPDEIYKKNITSTITDYAEVLYDRLKSDGHISKLVGILFGPSINVTRSDTDLLCFMGYLSEDLRDGEFYQTLSGYFTDFLHNKHYVDDSWKNIIAVDKLMKDLIAETFKPLTEEQWQSVMSRVYSELFSGDKDFNDKLYKSFIKNNKQTFGKDSTLLEVLNLNDTFAIIQCYWSVFKNYFDGRNFEDFREKFSLCAMARNPLAHGLEKYLTQLQQEQVNVYCGEILELVNKCRQKFKPPTFDPLAENSAVAPATKPPPPLATTSTVSEANIGKVGTLEDISIRKNGGLKGKIFGAEGTIARKLLNEEPQNYLGRTVQVKVFNINPQRTAYLLSLANQS